jgi:hypothetical protein
MVPQKIDYEKYYYLHLDFCQILHLGYVQGNPHNKRSKATGFFIRP